MDEKPLKILIVDDEEALRESTASILELYGYEIKTASCGNEAIEMVKKEPFDMLFSDMRMPDITGTDVIRAVKQIQPDLICIIMTAYALNELIVEALELGANFCLTKPFEIETMLNIIKELSEQPFVVVINRKENISKNFLSSLKQDGLNALFIEKGIGNIDFLKRHTPNDLIIGVDGPDDQIAKQIITEINSFGNKMDEIILTGPKEAENFKNTIIPVEGQQLHFVETPISINKIFYLITGHDRNFNIATISLQDDKIKDLFTKDKYTLFKYETQQSFLDQLKNNFFDIIIINANNEESLSEFHKNLHQLMPNVRILYLVNNCEGLASLEENTFYCLQKPYQTQDLFEKVNKIIGVTNGK